MKLPDVWLLFWIIMTLLSLYCHIVDMYKILLCIIYYWKRSWSVGRRIYVVTLFTFVPLLTSDSWRRVLKWNVIASRSVPHSSNYLYLPISIFFLFNFHTTLPSEFTQCSHCFMMLSLPSTKKITLYVHRSLVSLMELLALFSVQICDF